MVGLLLRLSSLLGLLNWRLCDLSQSAAGLRLVNVRSALASGVDELLALAPSVGLGLGFCLGHDVDLSRLSEIVPRFRIAKLVRRAASHAHIRFLKSIKCFLSGAPAHAKHLLGLSHIYARVLSQVCGYSALLLSNSRVEADFGRVQRISESFPMPSDVCPTLPTFAR